MADEKYILVGWLIDGSGAEVKRKVAMTIAGGKITSIGNMEKIAKKDPSLIIDLSYGTVLPPLIDCNVDLCRSATVDPRSRQNQEMAGFTETSLLMSQHIHFCHSHGVLGVAHSSNNKDYVLRYNEKNSTPDGETIIIKNSARLCRKDSGVDCGDDLMSLDSDLVKEIDRCDYVKVINSEEVSDNTSAATFSCYYNDNEMGEIIYQAKAKGKKIIVLANGELAVKTALQSGCHAIEQGALMGEANLRYMAESGVTWIPNIMPLESSLDVKKSVAREVIGKSVKRQIEQLSQARKLGVKVALGTGAGSRGTIHGESVVGEIRYLLKSGYSLVEAIRCATLNGAELFGINEMGLLQEGRPANFLVSRGMPAQLPRKLSYLEAIYRNGEPSKAYRKNPIKTVINK